MNGLLQASKQFERESKEQVETTRENVKSVVNEHANDLSQCLTDAQKEIEASIQEHKQRMIWLVTWIWTPVFLTILLLILATMGWGWWQQSTLTRQHNEIVQRRQTLSHLPNLITHKCHNGRMCIKINPAYKPKGPHHQYYVPEQSNGGL